MLLTPPNKLIMLDRSIIIRDGSRLKINLDSIREDLRENLTWADMFAEEIGGVFMWTENRMEEIAEKIIGKTMADRHKARAFYPKCRYVDLDKHGRAIVPRETAEKFDFRKTPLMIASDEELGIGFWDEAKKLQRIQDGKTTLL
ncbi:MAG: hypothetical protein FWD89_00245 [Firmicutes bacterium]|nr:hypothetical protein [Bacillota bacterium]